MTLADTTVILEYHHHYNHRRAPTLTLPPPTLDTTTITAVLLVAFTLPKRPPSIELVPRRHPRPIARSTEVVRRRTLKLIARVPAADDDIAATTK